MVTTTQTASFTFTQAMLDHALSCAFHGEYKLNDENWLEGLKPLLLGRSVSSLQRMSVLVNTALVNLKTVASAKPAELPERLAVAVATTKEPEVGDPCWAPDVDVEGVIWEYAGEIERLPTKKIKTTKVYSAAFDMSWEAEYAIPTTLAAIKAVKAGFRKPVGPPKAAAVKGSGELITEADLIIETEKPKAKVKLSPAEERKEMIRLANEAVAKRKAEADAKAEREAKALVDKALAKGKAKKAAPAKVTVSKAKVQAAKAKAKPAKVAVTKSKAKPVAKKKAA